MAKNIMKKIMIKLKNIENTPERKEKLWEMQIFRKLWCNC